MDDTCIICTLCGDGYNGGPASPATHTVSAPADTGPFTDVEESFDMIPTARWDMPVCARHRDEMLELVGCSSCRKLVYRIDSISNGSTVHLCRPCNKKENS